MNVTEKKIEVSELEVTLKCPEVLELIKAHVIARLQQSYPDLLQKQLVVTIGLHLSDHLPKNIHSYSEENPDCVEAYTIHVKALP